MVYYVCNGCGESLKRAKVDQHAMQCYGCEYVTCIDCNKDFWGNDYKAHTSCVSEAERYGKVGAAVKENKGEVKQRLWCEKVDQLTTSSKTLSNEAKKLLMKLQDYPNIPRKRAKFLNFLTNSLRFFNTKVAEEVWDAFTELHKQANAPKPPPPAPAASKPTEEDKPKESLPQNGKPEVASQEVDTDSAQENTNPAKKKKKKSSKEEETHTATTAEENGKPLSKKKKKKLENKALQSAASENKLAPTADFLEPTNDQKTSKKKKKRKLEETDENGNVEVVGKKKGKKRKADEASKGSEVFYVDDHKKSKIEPEEKPVNLDDTENEGSNPTKFPWKRTIRLCLKAADDNELSLKKLKKKVLQEYCNFQQTNGLKVISDNEMNVLVLKKINNNPKLLVKKERVRLK